MGPIAQQLAPNRICLAFREEFDDSRRENKDPRPWQLPFFDPVERADAAPQDTHAIEKAVHSPLKKPEE